MTALPEGTVTLLFSDIEGSTRLVRQSSERYAELLDVHRRLLRDAWSTWHGHELGTEGDSFFVVFERASDAVSAAAQAARAMAVEPWPDGQDLRVRIGIHTGEPVRHGDGYVGIDINRAARISSAAHGGQIVVSAATRQLVDGELPGNARFVDLGEHRLKDLSVPERLYQLQVDGLETDFPALKAPGAASTLPAHATSLIGRVAEREDLARLLCSDKAPLVTLTGPGGCGKTRLATAVAEELADAFPGGVYFVALAAVANTRGAIWAAVRDAVDATDDERSAASQLLDHLRGLRALLVLDNVEHLDEVASVVKEILDAAPKVSVVATSRRPLHLRGEHEYPLHPLALPAAPTMEAAVGSDAVELFVQQARLVRPGFELTSDNVGPVTAICTRLDGLPLALELAAARIKLLPPAALLARLDNALSLRAQEVDRPARQQTLGRTIAWSYELLSPGLQTLFCRLGVLSGGGDLDAVDAIACAPDGADALDVVADLADVSLLDVTEGADGHPRARLLEIVRTFALERLGEHDDPDRVKRRHATHYAGLVETLLPQLRRAEDYPLTRTRLDVERDNVRAAIGWALDTGDDRDRVTLGLRLAVVMDRAWGRYGGRAEAQRWLQRALELGSDEDGVAMAGALYESARFDLFPSRAVDDGPGRAGNRQRDRSEFLERALALYRDADDVPGMARTLADLGWCEAVGGRTGEARRSMEQALSLAEGNQDPALLAEIYAEYANVELRYGPPERALELTRRSLDEARRSGDQAFALQSDHDIAWALALMGDGAAAVRQLDKTARETVKRGDERILANHVWAYSVAYAAVGDAVLAARLQGASESRWHDLDAGMSVQDLDLAERCYAKARGLITSSEWEDARRQGALLSLTDAMAEAMATARRERAQRAPGSPR